MELLLANQPPPFYGQASPLLGLEPPPGLYIARYQMQRPLSQLPPVQGTIPLLSGSDPRKPPSY